MDLRSQILNLLNEENSQNSDEETEFNKDNYEKLYTIINEIILNIINSSYSALFISEKCHENFDFDNIIKLTNSNKVVEFAKVFVNLYWQDINNESGDNQDIKNKIKDIIELNILKNNYEVFSLIKSTILFVIITISRTSFEKADTYDLYIDKVFRMTNALLEINKITCLEDEDDLSSDITNPDKLDNTIFWN